jgi:hypothetical protein
MRVTVPGKQVRILWIAPGSARADPRNFQPEDAKTAEARRYIGDWSVETSTPETATLRASFDLPQAAMAYLSTSAPESRWSIDPWAFDKAYLVLLLKDETVEQNNQWVSDRLLTPKAAPPPGELETAPPAQALTAVINGVPKTLYPFKTGRNQPKGKTRCYFASLDGETKASGANQVRITLPIQRGLVFSGAYVDLPDQMPNGH